METKVIEILGGLLLLVAVVTIVFIIAKYNYLIKKAMIDKGIYVERVKMKYRYLDLGCIVFGLGVGLLVSSVFTNTSLGEDTVDLLVWGTILIFGAVGLILAHFIRKKLESQH